MVDVFGYGSFREYAKTRLDEARSPIPSHADFSTSNPTVFISHKHDDLAKLMPYESRDGLDNLRGVIGFLEKEFGVTAYIDSRDPQMPEVTSAETASRIKEKIRSCDKFILLATEAAISSKWCNWELGYGDACKFKDNIALFSMRSSDGMFSGSEYMRIYPTIAFYDGSEKFKDGRLVPSGYYVRELRDGRYFLKSLGKWFKEH